MKWRIVLDTNVLVAGVKSLSGASYRVLQEIERGSIEIALSVPLLLEYEDVLSRPGLHGWSEEEMTALLDSFCAVAHLQDVHFLWRPSLRDPKDDMVLEVAVAAGCRAVVTHNLRDFALAERFGLEIMSPYELLKCIGAAS